MIHIYSLSALAKRCFVCAIFFFTWSLVVRSQYSTVQHLNDPEDYYLYEVMYYDWNNDGFDDIVSNEVKFLGADGTSKLRVRAWISDGISQFNEPYLVYETPAFGINENDYQGFGISPYFGRMTIVDVDND